MISNVRLQHFRSYTDSAFEFGDGVNIIVGPNGSGKTNLIEAILVLMCGSSYRATDTDLIEFEHDWARLDARTSDSVRTIKLQRNNQTRKTYNINENKYTHLSEKQQIPVVLFEPNHLSILQGPPEGRRNYLDEVLTQTQPGYTSVRRNYKRVLAQRNTLLKHHKARSQDFFPWNLRLSELGAVIHRQRAQYVAEMNEQIGALYAEISTTNTQVSLVYESRFSSEGYETQLFQALENNLEKDVLRGFTTHGPHREDMIVLFNGVPSELTASRGETRTVVLALKILELRAVEAAQDKKPLLLLDDVFSELDGARRRALTAYLHRYQSFITTTDADIVVKHFTSSTILPVG